MLVESTKARLYEGYRSLKLEELLVLDCFEKPLDDVTKTIDEAPRYEVHPSPRLTAPLLLGCSERLSDVARRMIEQTVLHERSPCLTLEVLHLQDLGAWIDAERMIVSLIHAHDAYSSLDWQTYLLTFHQELVLESDVVLLVGGPDSELDARAFGRSEPAEKEQMVSLEVTWGASQRCSLEQ